MRDVGANRIAPDFSEAVQFGGLGSSIWSWDCAAIRLLRGRYRCSTLGRS